MDLLKLIQQISSYAIGWPLMVYVIVISLIYTIVLRGIQFRYFFTALKAALFPSPKGNQQKTGMTPFQAFMNTVNSNLGNGSIAGMGNAIYLGGPGAALWVVIFGFILMSVRFAEVYISSIYGMQTTEKTTQGGRPNAVFKRSSGTTSFALCLRIFLSSI